MASQEGQPVALERAARIGDVAAAAGVSTATVSRTLAFPERVRPQTRALVLEAVQRLGYTPNEAARALRAGATRMILVVIPQSYSGAFFAGVINGVDAELSAFGFTMIMGSLDGPEDKARRLVDLVFARQIDGVIILNGSVPTIQGRSILDAGVPVVAVCAALERQNLPTVLVNDEACGALQTRHLIALGHRRLHYVAGIKGNYNEVHRYRGFLKEARAAGLSAERLSRSPGNYSLASGVAAAQEYLELSPRPTGVVCCSDEMAIGFLKTVAQAGVRCPQEISVVGFDGIEFGEFCEPALTTIRQPRFELGQTGARALLQVLRGESEPARRRIVLTGELVIRGSTAPSPQPLRPKSSSLRPSKTKPGGGR